MLGRGPNSIQAWKQPKPQHFKYLLPLCATAFLSLKKGIFSIRLWYVGSPMEGYLALLTEVTMCSRLSQHFEDNSKESVQARSFLW